MKQSKYDYNSLNKWINEENLSYEEIGRKYGVTENADISSYIRHYLFEKHHSKNQYVQINWEDYTFEKISNQ